MKEVVEQTTSIHLPKANNIRHEQGRHLRRGLSLLRQVESFLKRSVIHAAQLSPVGPISCLPAGPTAAVNLTPALFVFAVCACLHVQESAAMKNLKLVLYVCCLFVAARVAGSIGGDPKNVKVVDSEVHVAVIADTSDPDIQRKIVAFKKGGVGKKIKNNNYDIDGVIEYATSLLRTPHVMGGYSSSGVDCSGLVKMAHARFDVELPRSSHDQGRYGAIISSRKDIKRGDLVFFHSTYPKPHLITHTGIYLGDNKFIHASSSRGVTISTLFDSGYYQKHYLFATRLRK